MNKQMLSIRIPKEINEEFTIMSKKIGITKNAIVLTLIDRELKKLKIKDKG